LWGGALVLDYQNNGRRALDTLKGRLRPLRAFFGDERALDITGKSRYRIVNEDDIERALAQTQEAIKQAPPSNLTDLVEARQARDAKA